MNVPDSLPLEFLNLQEFGETGLDVIDEAPRCNTIVSEVFVCEGVTTQGVNGFLGNNIDKSCNVAMALHRLRHRRMMKHQNELKETRSCDRIDPSGEAKVFSASGDLSSRANFGILDTGATKTVIGSQLIKGLMNSLDPEIRNKVGRYSCNITFRFGNLSTLDSQHALVIPVGRVKLKVAVVPGQTPFLVSNTLIRALKA